MGEWIRQQGGRGIFNLYYLDECPYKIGDKLPNPVTDGLGNWTEFRGDAYIETLEYTTSFDGPAEIVAGAAHYYDIEVLI